MGYSELDMKIQSSVEEYIHESWIPFFAPPLLYFDLLEDKRGRRYLSRAILKESRSCSSGKYDFVADRDALFRLVIYCGLGGNYELFRCVIDKRDLGFIRKVFGEGVHDFLYRYVPFLGLGSLPLLKVKRSGNMYEEVFRAGLRLVYWSIGDDCAKEYVRLASPASMRNEIKAKKPKDMLNYSRLFDRVKKYLGLGS